MGSLISNKGMEEVRHSSGSVYLVSDGLVSKKPGLKSVGDELWKNDIFL